MGTKYVDITFEYDAPDGFSYTTRSMYNITHPTFVEALNTLLDNTNHRIIHLRLLDEKLQNSYDVLNSLEGNYKWMLKSYQTLQTHYWETFRKQKKEEKMAFLENTDTKQNGLIVPLHSIKGGKTGDGEDWLSGIAVGTNFLVKPIVSKAQDPRMQQPESPNLLECSVEYKVPEAVALEIDLNGQIAHIWVDPKIFCRQNSLHVILEEPTINVSE